MPESYTQRGFADYLHLTDRYDNEVIVRQSSLATEECVWILCHAGPNWNRALDHNGEVIQPSPHLNIEMARKVRDALQEFIDAHEPIHG